MQYKFFRKRTKKQYLASFLVLVVLLGIGTFVYVKVALGATATWTNSGGDNLWSTCANWSGGTGVGGCPGSSDVATFNGSTSNASVTIDTAVSVAGINFSNSYSGTLTQQSGITITVGSSNYAQSSGTFVGGDSTFNVNGSFTLSGGTFTPTSGTFSVTNGSATFSGGTYNGSGKTLTFAGSTNATFTLTCAGPISGTVDDTRTANTLVISRQCTVTFPASLTASSAITNNGIINATAITLNDGSFTNAGILNMTGTMTFAGSVNSTVTLTCKGAFPATVDDTRTAGTFVVSSGCSVTFASTVSTSGAITNNGIINANNITLTDAGLNNTGGQIYSSGTITFAGTLNSTVTLTCNGDLGVTVNITRSLGTFVLTSDCRITLTSSVSAGVNITNNGVISATDITLTDTNFTGTGRITGSGTLTFAGTSNTNNSLTCTGTLGINVNVTKTLGSLTISSGCTVTFVSSVSTNANITNNGTLNATAITVTDSSTFNNSGTLNLTGTLTLTDTGNSTLTLTCGTAAIAGNLTINKTIGSLTLADNCTFGGNLTRTIGRINNPGSAKTLSFGGNFSMSTTDTFGGANLTLVANGSGTQTITQNNGGTMSGKFQVNKATGTASLSTDFTTGSTCDVLAGTFDINSFAFTCGSTFTVANGATLKLVGSESSTTPTLSTGSTVFYKGNGDGLANTYQTQNWTYSNLTINTTDSNDIISPAGIDSVTGSLGGYWKFDDGSGSTAADSSGNSNTGTLNVSPTWLGSAQFGGGITFNATLNQSVSVANNSSLNPSNITVAAWAKSTTSTWNQYGFLASKRNAYILHPEQSSRDVTFYIYTGSFKSLTCTGPSDITTWHFYVGTWDGTTLKCYIDGVLGNSSTPGGSLTTSDTNTLYIGCDCGSSTSRVFNGSEDEVRIYNKAQNQTAITNLFNNNSTSSTAITSVTVTGNFTQANGTFVAPSGTMTIGGNFTNSGGTFTHNSGTVTFNDATQNSTITGTTTFSTLTSTTAGKHLFFENGKTQTVATAFTITGGASAPITLRSTTGGSQWTLTKSGSATVSYAAVQDSNATNAITATTSRNLGNNTNWTFSASGTGGVTMTGKQTITGKTTIQSN